MVPISYRHLLPAPASRLAKSFSKPLYRIDSGACSSVRQSYKDVSVRWQWLKAATLLYCISNPERHQSFKNSAPFRRHSPFTRPGALTGCPDGTRTRRIKKITHGNEHRSRSLPGGVAIRDRSMAEQGTAGELATPGNSVGIFVPGFHFARSFEKRRRLPQSDWPGANCLIRKS